MEGTKEKAAGQLAPSVEGGSAVPWPWVTLLGFTRGDARWYRRGSWFRIHTHMYTYAHIHIQIR